MSLKVGDFMKEAKFQCEKFYSWLKHQNYISQEHCTNWVTGFLIPIWKLIQKKRKGDGERGGGSSYGGSIQDYHFWLGLAS